MKCRRYIALLAAIIVLLSLAACRQQAQEEESTSISETEEPQVTCTPEEARIMEMLGGMISYAELMEYADFELIDVDTDLQKDPIVYYGQQDGVVSLRRKSGAEEYTFDRDGVRYTYSLKDGAATLEDYVFLEDLDAAALTTSGMEIAVTGTDLYLNHAALPVLTSSDIVTEEADGGKILRVGVEYFARFARALCEAQGMTASEVEDVLESFSMELIYDVADNQMQVNGGWTALNIIYDEMDFGIIMNSQVEIDTTLSGRVYLTENGEALERVELEIVRTDGEAEVKSTLKIYDMVLENGAMVACKTDTKDVFTCTVTVGTYQNQVTYDVTATLKSETVLSPKENIVMKQKTEQTTNMVARGKNYSINSFEDLAISVSRLMADTYDFDLSYHKNGSQETGYLKATLKPAVDAIPMTIPAPVEQAAAEASAEGGEVARMMWEREAIAALTDHLNETYPAAPIWFSAYAIIDAEEGGDILNLIIDTSRTTPGDYRIQEYHRSPAVDQSYYETNDIPYYRFQNGELTALWLPEVMDYLDRFSRAFLESDHDVARDQPYHVMDSAAGYVLMFDWYTDHFGAMKCFPLELFSYENFMASEATLPESMRSTELKYADGKFQ